MEWVGAWGDPQYPASGRLCVRESHWASLEDPLINQGAESNHFQHPIYNREHIKLLQLYME